MNVGVDSVPLFWWNFVCPPRAGKMPTGTRFHGQKFRRSVTKPEILQDAIDNRDIKIYTHPRW